jgi:transcription elongation factor GreB
MSRYRPPAARKSPYITLAGMRVLEAEQKSIWLKRREVVAALSAAAAEGDRSENAEYIYRKKELRELDRRIRYLQKRLPELNVVAEKPVSSEKVFFGAMVRLEDKSGALVSYRIVGPDEFDHEEDYISVDSPLAQSLIKPELGDEVEVEVPSGRLVYTIVGISY